MIGIFRSHGAFFLQLVSGWVSECYPWNPTVLLLSGPAKKQGLPCWIPSSQDSFTLPKSQLPADFFPGFMEADLQLAPQRVSEKDGFIPRKGCQASGVNLQGDLGPT